jgi:hypothetical protein
MITPSITGDPHHERAYHASTTGVGTTSFCATCVQERA